MKFFDLHCDTPYESYKKGEPFCDGQLAVNLCRGAVFEKWCQVCAIWIPDECRQPSERYFTVLQNFCRQAEIICDSEGLDRKRCLLLSLEGGAVLQTPDDVDRIHSDGIRVVTLTWNGKNKLAGGANSNGRLTELGRTVIKRMNQLKMAVDVSHLNDASFFEVLEVADRVLATHSCSRSVFYATRNLTDAQMRAIAQKGGIIGICLYPRFLGEGDVFADFNAHLEHIIQTVGESCVAIGSDFDGAQMDVRLDSIDKIPVLHDYLKSVGRSDETLDKLFFSNAYEYFKELLK